jgi:GntR family transcriptional regulator
LNSPRTGGNINSTMFDIQHDSPVPIHEQIASQLMGHIASGALKAGAKLAEYRMLAQELVTNPQVVARAYGDLEWEGVLKKGPAGVMEVTEGAAVVCRLRLQDMARARLRQAIANGLACRLSEADIRQIVEQALAAKVEPLSPDELRHAIKKQPTHDSSHRDAQAIQDLSREKSPGSAQPDHPQGGDFRPARG